MAAIFTSISVKKLSKPALWFYELCVGPHLEEESRNISTNFFNQFSRQDQPNDSTIPNRKLNTYTVYQRNQTSLFIFFKFYVVYIEEFCCCAGHRSVNLLRSFFAKNESIFTVFLSYFLVANLEFAGFWKQGEKKSLWSFHGNGKRSVWRNIGQERTKQNARIYFTTTLPYNKGSYFQNIAFILI